MKKQIWYINPEISVCGKVLKQFASTNPDCICLEYVGDNGKCPVHGDPYKSKREQEEQKRQAVTA